MSTRMTISKAVRRALLASAATAASLAYPTAFGQSTSGSVFGQATAGETVMVESALTGFHREIAVDKDGSYRMPALPPGNYKVTLKHADGTTAVRDIAVSAGTGTQVNFVAATSEARSPKSSAPRAINPIDVSSVESTTILTAEQIAKIPVARDPTSACAARSRHRARRLRAFGNLASFGGASVAENAVLRQRLQRHQLVPQPELLEDSVRSDRRAAGQDRRLRRRVRPLARWRRQPDHQARYQ